MFDLADSFIEGVKISLKHKFRGEPVPKNNCGWIKRLLIILCLGMDLSIQERVHVSGESLGLQSSQKLQNSCWSEKKIVEQKK